MTSKISTLIQQCKNDSLDALNCKVTYVFVHHMIDINLFTCSQIDVSGSRKAVVIHVPYRLRKAFRKVHVKLVRELEKKFSGKVRKGLSYSFSCKFVLFSIMKQCEEGINENLD